MEENNLVKIETEAKKNNNPLSNILSSLVSGNMLLPMMLFFLFNKGETQKFNSEDIYNTAAMIKTAQPYFKDQHREMLAKTENVLDILHAVNRLQKGEYASTNRFGNSYYNVPNKPIKMMEAVRPYMKGKSKESIDKVLTLNDRVNRLKNRNPGDVNIMEDFDNMVGILEIISADKGYEVRNVLDKVHKMMAILRK
ncbi:hypothetical protein HNQ80_003027 [Anaerosolibacter carboniphilus]|uniref:Uncharacterized protein n=1 Tax=Anaerosolibacter carboniphilus TaxID=1417629 RepID=A0A841L172_9FIRM|nr:hypothetical protein [Anaerosolibacter carboniphilus]MBB6216922.1 hypothetical protein [Anaerosolibacter carboniphilus]